MSIIKKLIKYCIDSDFRFIVNANRFGMYKGMSDEVYLKRIFKAFHGYTPNLVHPKTLNEKLQWLKLMTEKVFIPLW